MNLPVAICFVLTLYISSWTGTSATLHSRIIQGQNTRIESHPYQVSIRSQGTHFCGGSIISEKHILTAAHCIDERMVPPYTNARVHTGTSDSHLEGHAHRIAGVMKHPQYVPTGGHHNDLAIITLADPITFDNSQQKIPLASRDSQDGERAVLTGWGSISPDQHVQAGILKKANAVIISSTNCRSQLQHVAEIYNEHVCAKVVPAGGACGGDSGGPLVVNGELVGITSWIDPPCGKGSPDVFTKVSAYRDFIKTAMSSPPPTQNQIPQFQLPSDDGYDPLFQPQYPQIEPQYPQIEPQYPQGQWYPQAPEFQYPGFLYPGLEG